MDTDFFFSLTPNGTGADAAGSGIAAAGPIGPDHDSLPLTAMAGINGQLKATSVSKGGTFDYYSDIAPQPDGSGGYTFNNGGVSEFENGIPLTEPVGSMAALSGVMLATSWTGTSNYFFELHENGASTRAYGNNFAASSWAKAAGPSAMKSRPWRAMAASSTAPPSMVSIVSFSGSIATPMGRAPGSTALVS